MSPSGKMLVEEEVAGRLAMGEKERLRSKILEMVKQGQMTLKTGSVTLRIRQYEGPPKIEYRGLAAESGIPHILGEA
jgi:hypothetical protein